MDIYRHVLNADSLSLLSVFFTAFTVATLVPPVHRFLPRPLQAVIWIGFVGVSVLRVTGVTDPKVREATSALVWAGGGLLYMQAAAVPAAVQGWIAANSFTVAILMIVAAGADVLALALIRSHRSARLSMPGVHLGEWFVLPRPAAAPAPDPLVEVDRRFATWTRTALQSVGRSAAARAVFVKPFAHAAMHLLGPGPARLRMLKLALGLEAHGEAPPLAAATYGEPAAAHARHAARLRHSRTRRRWGTARVLYIDKVLNASPAQPAKPRTTRSVQRGEKKDGVAARRADRLAS